MKSSGRGSRRNTAIRFLTWILEGHAGRTKKRGDGHGSPSGLMGQGGRHKQVCSPTNVSNQAEAGLTNTANFPVYYVLYCICIYFV